MSRKMSLIVAADNLGGIGKDGGIPWRIRGDMEHFRRKTSEVNDHNKRNAVIMGRKCWWSIPAKFRPLPGRLNIVLSRTMTAVVEEGVLYVQLFQYSSVLVRQSLESAMEEVSNMKDIEKVWNIGGSQVYSEALQKGLVDCIELTRVDAEFPADVFVEGIPPPEFVEVERSQENEEKGIKYRFFTYKKQ